MATKKKKAPKAKPAPKKKASSKAKAAPKKAQKKASPKAKVSPKKKASPKAKTSSAPNPNDKAAFAPGALVKHDDNYSIIYAKFPHVEAFEEHGIEGGGYTWHGLVVHVLQEDDPKALDALDFDPEGSMFCAVSKDLNALQAVGRALKKLEDPAVLTKLAGTVDLSEYD